MIYTFLNPKGGVGWTHGSRFAAMVRTAFALLVVFLCVLSGALAAVNDEPQFIFNTFSFLVWGGLVMWMGRRIHYARVRIDTCLVRRELDIVQYDHLRERLLEFHKSLVGQQGRGQ